MDNGQVSMSGMLHGKPVLIVLVGLPGSGKSTFCKQSEYKSYVRINQDEQGKLAHRHMFDEALEQRRHIIVDRCNFNVDQRSRYLKPAQEAGYYTIIVWLQRNAETCIERIKSRTEHPNLSAGNEKIESVVNMFDGMFVAPKDNESNEIWYL